MARAALWLRPGRATSTRGGEPARLSARPVRGSRHETVDHHGCHEVRVHLPAQHRLNELAPTPFRPGPPILQSRAVCSKVDPSCSHLKADEDGGPHLLSYGPSANALGRSPRVQTSRPGRSRLDLWGDGVDELAMALAAHSDRRSIGQATPLAPFTLTPGRVIRCAVPKSSTTPTGYNGPKSLSSGRCPMRSCRQTLRILHPLKARSHQPPSRDTSNRDSDGSTLR